MATWSSENFHDAFIHACSAHALMLKKCAHTQNVDSQNARALFLHAESAHGVLHAPSTLRSSLISHTSRTSCVSPSSCARPPHAPRTLLARETRTRVLRASGVHRAFLLPHAFRALLTRGAPLQKHPSSRPIPVPCVLAQFAQLTLRTSCTTPRKRTSCARMHGLDVFLAPQSSIRTSL